MSVIIYVLVYNLCYCCYAKTSSSAVQKRHSKVYGNPIAPSLYSILLVCLHICPGLYTLLVCILAQDWLFTHWPNVKYEMFQNWVAYYVCNWTFSVLLWKVKCLILIDVKAWLNSLACPTKMFNLYNLQEIDKHIVEIIESLLEIAKTFKKLPENFQEIAGKLSKNCPKVSENWLELFRS